MDKEIKQGKAAEKERQYASVEKTQEEKRIEALREMVQNAAAEQSEYVGSSVGSREFLASLQNKANQNNTLSKK